MGKRLGLIIGINSYQDATFRSLQYAEMDARALAQWLVNAKGGNWSPADVQFVQGAYATRELLESLITQICAGLAGADDQALVYFAGHGFLDERTGDSYLALAHSRYLQPETALHVPSLLEKALGRSHARQVIVVFDYVQTGRLWKQRRTTLYDSTPLIGPSVLQGLQRMPNRLVLCSCRGNEQASEAGDKSLGVFAYRTIVGLCGPARDPATGQITLQRLHTYLSTSLGTQQRPQLFGQATEAVVLVGDLPAPRTSDQLLPPSGGSPVTSPSANMPRAASMQPNTTGTLLTQQPQMMTAVADPQMSPTTSGQLALPQVEQQIAMFLRQARHLMQMQNPAEALKYIEQALQINPMNADAYMLKAQLFGNTGRIQEALQFIEQALQLNPNNALAWSVRGVLLSNVEQYQLALQSIERSLELDPNNLETHAIKTHIMDHMAMLQSLTQSSKHQRAAVQQNSAAGSFIIGLGVQALGLIIGGIGAALPVMRPTLPILLALLLQSAGLALLCVNAARGAYLHGFLRVLLTLFFSIVTAAALGGLYKFGLNHFYAMAQANPAVLIPILYGGLWLAAAAVVPLVLSIGAFIASVIARMMGKRRA